MCAQRAAPTDQACPCARAHGHTNAQLPKLQVFLNQPTKRTRKQRQRARTHTHNHTHARTHALPVIQKTLKQAKRKAQTFKVSPETSRSHFSPHLTSKRTHVALARTGAHAHARKHKRTFICFAFLPSSCIRCRQKVRFRRQPGMVMGKRGRGLGNGEGGGGEEE